jgi:murein DD-endopeptidase MepM/ murein hydrolase activator NlpD
MFILFILAMTSLSAAKIGQRMELRESGDTDPITPSIFKPGFSDHIDCVGTASPYGSRTRYDGSNRPQWAPGGGRHGGIDLTLSEGTPLIALASGRVIAKGKGGRMLGIYMWLRHSPSDTGLEYWVFSKYQHLNRMPVLGLGAKVSLGDVIGESGKTGTTGGHYRYVGYPHLHLTTRRNLNGEYELDGDDLNIINSELFDPLELY